MPAAGVPATPAASAEAAVPAPAAAPRSSGLATGTWEWPTRGKLLRAFDGSSNKGIDIGGEPGQIVVASRAGKVVYSGSALKGYGELIIIKHDEDTLSAYGYNRRRMVEEGDSVVGGQPIAELGFGPENKPLLHFEIRDHGKPVDPKQLLPAR
jgi:lipoprotein NlpD